MLVNRYLEEEIIRLGREEGITGDVISVTAGLVSKGILPKGFDDLLEEFGGIRSYVAHGERYAIPTLRKYLDIGSRLLKVVMTPRTALQQIGRLLENRE